MRQWCLLYNKEMMEMWRNGKWLWVPIVFMLLGVMQPIVSFYMPQILEMAGNLPEGAVIQIPVPAPSEVMAEVLSQYGVLGLLILVLASMGLVSAERASGIAAMILVKPVSTLHYLSAKWAGIGTLTAVSLGLGMAASWYYTEVLIGSVGFNRIAISGLIFLLWLMFILSVNLLMSTWLKGGASIAFVTLLVAAVLSLASSLFGKWMDVSPARLSGFAREVLLTGETGDGFGLCLVTTVLLIGCLLAVSVWIFHHRELANGS